MTFLTFIRNNARWLVGGLTLTFFSSAGQTFFIAQFASDVRGTFDLSHGEFGAVYMLATLGSAVTLIYIGKIVDHRSVREVSAAVILLLAGACILMATATSVPALVLAIYVLRLFGQGMMSHTAMTAMGRWFVAERGRAVTLTSTGNQLGEAALPISVVALLSLIDWRTVWWICAAVLVLVALPLTRMCFGRDRTPLMPTMTVSEIGYQWTSREVLRDGPFWIVCVGVLAPAFIGTSVFFHQVHLGEIKQWPSTTIAGSFGAMSITTVIVALLSGQLIDRFSARQMLPIFLAPLGLGCFVLAQAVHPDMMLIFMGLLGMGYGFSSAIFGAIWAEVYGTRHLGSIRSIVVAAMVVASALGPGITGWLIDQGVAFDRQLIYMGYYCLFAVIVMIPVSRNLHRRITQQALLTHN